MLRETCVRAGLAEGMGETMRRWSVLAGFGLALGGARGIQAECQFPKTHARTTVTYRFAPEISPDRLRLHVAMEFRAGADGTARLILPVQWAGETLHAMTDLHVVSDGVMLADADHANAKIVRTAPNKAVVIGYDLQKDWPGPLVHPMQFHPVLMPSYLEFTGSNALVAVDVPKTEQETANFDWERLPPDWALATSFGDSTSAAGRCQSFTGTRPEINDGLYAAGDFRIHHFQIGRRPAVLAVRGTWTFTDEEAIGEIQKVVGLVRDFWHEDDFPYFLVTLKPYDQDHGSSDGSAFTNAFWMYVSRLDGLNGLLPQLAHESFHAWNPFRMGAQGSQADFEETKWFKEGVTEYYAQLLTYRAGELSEANYVASLNKDLRSFTTSTSEYVRGRILALWMDGTIRRESQGKRSLDNVMFDMERHARQPYDLARILATAGRYLSPRSRGLLRRAVEEHGDLAPPEVIPSLSLCARPVLEDLPTFDIGLDLAHSRASSVLVGVRENGPAFAAGLRNGQRITGMNVYNGDPERVAKFTIRSDGKDREIAFLPRGETVKAWQYGTGKGCAV